MKLLIQFGYGAVGAPGVITVAWGLTRPKSGPAIASVYKQRIKV